jgi:phospholipase C
MSKGLDKLQHIVVLMMENRSFDHMLGGLMAQDPRINGLTGNESNPDTNGAPVLVQPNALFQSQLDPDPDHHFAAVDKQIFGGSQAVNRVANMQGFVTSYFDQRRDVKHSHLIMNYFPPAKLPVLTNLAKQFAVFNGWFASIPGPTLCNRAFAHYGTSFGEVGMSVNYIGKKYPSIYQRMLEAKPKRTAKIFYFDIASSTLEVVNLVKDEPEAFGTYDQFLAACDSGDLPQYSFIEPNYTDHDSDTGEEVASDQHPDHDVQAGEVFMARVYNAIRQNQELWESTALLIVYDEHGGIYDHVVPPACPTDPDDDFTASTNATETGNEFKFDRLGVRVPAVLVSPWIPKGTVVPGPAGMFPNGRTFEHASIPNTVTNFFLGGFDKRSGREKASDTFLDLLTLDTPRTDAPVFQVQL